MRLREPVCGGCDHERGWHRRGWGPCTWSSRVTVIDADGATRGDGRVSCECRRFTPTAKPAGARNGR